METLAEPPAEDEEEQPRTGIFHAAGSGACSWYDLAVEVFDRAGVGCRVVPTTAEAFRRPAPRPAYSVLGTERPEAPVLPAWQEGVAGYLSDRMAEVG
ncbi:MAG: sugar nucleotide-binding protein [Solirubrobacteraceae bacterium]